MSNYKELTIEQIQEAFKEYFPDGTFEQEPLENKLLPGYAYSVDSPTTKINTGIGGIKLYIEACRKEGFPDWLIAKSITVYTDQGPVTLDKLKVTKNDTNNTRDTESI